MNAGGETCCEPKRRILVDCEPGVTPTRVRTFNRVVARCRETERYFARISCRALLNSTIFHLSLQFSRNNTCSVLAEIGLNFPVVNFDLCSTFESIFDL